MRTTLILLLAALSLTAYDKIDPKTMSAPKPIHKAEPKYSDEARAAKIEGAVLLKVFIETDGTAGEIEVLRPLGYGLDQKAIEAVKAWRFEPARQIGSGEPIRVRANIEINFRLP